MVKSRPIGQIYFVKKTNMFLNLNKYILWRNPVETNQHILDLYCSAASQRKKTKVQCLEFQHPHQYKTYHLSYIKSCYLCQNVGVISETFIDLKLSFTPRIQFKLSNQIPILSLCMFQNTLDVRARV